MNDTRSRSADIRGKVVRVLYDHRRAIVPPAVPLPLVAQPMSGRRGWSRYSRPWCLRFPRRRCLFLHPLTRRRYPACVGRSARERAAGGPLARPPVGNPRRRTDGTASAAAPADGRAATISVAVRR